MDRKDMIIDAATNYGYAVAGGSLERPYISTAYMKGAEWADKNPREGMVSIDDVCDYLYDNWKGDDHYITDIIEGLRNNMKK